MQKICRFDDSILFRQGIDIFIESIVDDIYIAFPCRLLLLNEIVSSNLFIYENIFNFLFVLFQIFHNFDN